MIQQIFDRKPRSDCQTNFAKILENWLDLRRLKPDPVQTKYRPRKAGRFDITLIFCDSAHRPPRKPSSLTSKKSRQTYDNQANLRSDRFLRGLA